MDNPSVRKGAPVVDMRHIVKRYGALTALNEVDFQVMAGEQVAIIGSSGSGKSTLLRCINCLETIQQGTIRLDGETLAEEQDGRVHYPKENELLPIVMKTGMVFQHFHLFPHLTCLGNITIAPVKVKNEDPVQVDERAMELLKVVGLQDKANAYPAQLSGGQKQRIAIARALAMRPRVLLFDEPTSALDPEVIGEVLKVIHDLAKQDYTMILVTHEMGFAREVADRIVFMDEGKIIEEGPPDSLFQNPSSQRLRSFLSAVL